MCALLTCIEYNSTHHTGKTCTQHQEEICQLTKAETAARARAEAKHVKHVKKHYKACPNKKCGTPIHKYGGCECMTSKKANKSSAGFVLLITDNFLSRQHSSPRQLQIPHRAHSLSGLYSHTSARTTLHHSLGKLHEACFCLDLAGQIRRAMRRLMEAHVSV